MSRFVSDVLRIMRLAIARRNENDPDSDDTTLRQYINDFVNLTMTEDVRLFEQFGSYTFNIDQTNLTGVYEVANLLSPVPDFASLSSEAFISLTIPVGGSVSWNRLQVVQDPGFFYQYWGVNNETILIPGYPTMMLYYGTQFVFRTIPNTAYSVYLYGYKTVDTMSDDEDQVIPFDYWLRYIAYGAAMNYARDYRFDGEKMAQLKADFAHERKLLLGRTHNQIKKSRSYPRF